MQNIKTIVLLLTAFVQKENVAAQGIGVSRIFSGTQAIIPEIEISLNLNTTYKLGSVRSRKVAAQQQQQRMNQRTYGSSLRAKNSLLVVEDQSDSLSRIFSRIVIWDDNGDTRQRVNETTTSPWKFIGKVGDFCSGSLIGPRHVLTAAHCVWDSRTKSLRPNLDFIPALNEIDQPYGVFKQKTVLLLDEFKLGNDRNFDFAVVVLEQAAGDIVGSLSYGEDCGNREYFVLNIGGYPYDKFPYDSMWATSCQGVKLECSQNLFNHKCDTFGGMSGSPMFFYRQDVGGVASYSIRGLHTNGIRKSGNAYNQGIMITPQIAKTLNQWIAQNP